MKYAFIQEHAQQYAITLLCRTVEVSESGYYEWLSREPSAHERKDGELSKQISQIFHEHRQVYGSPRVHAELQAQGVQCCKQRVARLMREMGLVAKARRSNKPVATSRRRGAAVATNVLNREFHAEAPNRKWVSDTTYVWTSEGWLYLAVILDLFSRLVVGWAMSASNDEPLVRQALEMALLGRTPAHELLLHSDQGSPYTSGSYLNRVSQAGMVVSMSRVGECYDNAAIESFFSTLKGECTERTRYQTRQELVKRSLNIQWSAFITVVVAIRLSNT